MGKLQKCVGVVVWLWNFLRGATGGMRVKVHVDEDSVDVEVGRGGCDRECEHEHDETESGVLR